MARLEYRKKAGEVVDVELAKEAVFGSFRRIRDSWQQWPARVYAELASELGVEPEKMRGALETREGGA